MRNIHIREKVNKAYSMLGIIKRNFKHIDKVAFIMLYKSLVQSFGICPLSMVTTQAIFNREY